MKKLVLSFFLFWLFLPSPSYAQTPPPSPVETTYTRGKVESVTKPELTNDLYVQEVHIKPEGEDSSITIENTYPKDAAGFREIQQSDEIVLSKSILSDGTTSFSIMDRYRLTPLLWISAIFFLIVVLAAGKKGLGAIIGLGISFAVILLYIVPQILDGSDPLLIAISGSLFIMAVTIYLAHGFSQKTTIAVVSTFLSLVITGLLAVFMVNLLNLQGLGTEDAYLLQFSNVVINLKGLLLGGIIIGTLGVLDDITTAQTSTIFEIAKANEKLGVKELFFRGYTVGKEHITSLVNTLVLAYAGASLPIFLFFVLNPLNRPWWMILNSELVVEEIVRTLAGSIGLILAVPITTLLAAFLSRYKIKIT